MAQRAKSPAVVNADATTSSRSSVAASRSSSSRVRAISSAVSQKRSREPPLGNGASTGPYSSATWAAVQMRLPPLRLARY